MDLRVLDVSSSVASFDAAIDTNYSNGSLEELSLAKTAGEDLFVLLHQTLKNKNDYSV